MLKRCAQLLGLVNYNDRDSRKRKELTRPIRTLDMSIQLKDITVRIIHAGGRQELYKTAIPASRLMEKYPGMCVARPEVFRKPQESILSAEDHLLPGQKYFIVPCTTVQKVKRRHSSKRKVKEPEILLLDSKASADVDGCSGESVRSSDFYESTSERQSQSSVGKSKKSNKQFFPPIQRSKSLRGLAWEPSLRSVEELST
ncbi:hypothetical protein POM88_002869 [Heracleum sosnowskyi]|uniref:Uncharacterized protein n=1 Tax=Heracleum sosnowskyi TaxID=360622 RepID=A0AAD8NAZ5_9APIA|nr:hypothetical protein POM88_002869 [Heracleum sosnowskyi]